MTADIEALPGIRWSAHAALADAMKRVPPESACMVIWYGEDGHVKWSQSSKNRMEVLWSLELAKQELLHDCA